MSDIDKLLQISPPMSSPSSISKTLDFVEIERKLKREVPEDFKQILNCYILGSFVDFIWILSPFSENPNLNLFEHLAYENEMFEESLGNEDESFEFELWPSTVGIIPWATTANGDVIYWRTVSSLVQVVVRESRSFNFQIFPFGISKYLVDILTKQISVDCFPDDLPDEPYFKHEAV